MRTKKKGGWRILKIGEQVRATDQFRNSVAGWKLVGGLSPYQISRIHWPHRRWDSRIKKRP